MIDVGRSGGMNKGQAGGARTCSVNQRSKCIPWSLALPPKSIVFRRDYDVFEWVGFVFEGGRAL